MTRKLPITDKRRAADARDAPVQTDPVAALNPKRRWFVSGFVSENGPGASARTV